MTFKEFHNWAESNFETWHEGHSWRDGVVPLLASIEESNRHHEMADQLKAWAADHLLLAQDPRSSGHMEYAIALARAGKALDGYAYGDPEAWWDRLYEACSRLVD